MDMRGRWGLSRNCVCKSDGEISSGQTPGKFLWKNFMSFCEGFSDMELKWLAGAKRVQVKDLSREGIAMNMKEPPGQMCRWFGSMAKEESDRFGAMWNSHHRVSMYSCW